MAITEFGKQIADLTKKFLRRELEQEAFLKEERERVRAAILELSNSPRFRSYACFLLHCRKQAQHNNIAKDVLEELYRYLILDDGPAGKDERFEAYLHHQCQLFASRDALPWSCGIRVRNDIDENWYAPVLLEGIPMTTAPDFAERVFMTSPQLLRNVLLEIWRGDASVRNTTDGRLRRCEVFLVKLNEEVPANTFVWIKMGLDESGCGDHCEASANEIYAPMKICLFEARTRVCLWEKHWHLAFGTTTGGASGNPGQVAPWVGLEALMHQALTWLEKWEGSDDEEEAVVTWLYRAEQVMRKQDKFWLRHVLDVLLIELRKQPRQLHQALGDIDVDNLRAEGQADSSDWEILRLILSDYETRHAERHADDAESLVSRSDVVISLLRAVIADGDNADNAADEFAHVVRMMVSEDVEVQAGPVARRADLRRATQARVVLMRDTLELFVNHEPPMGSTEAREALSEWINSTTSASYLQDGQPKIALTELLRVLRRWPAIAGTALGRGFLRSIEAESHPLRLRQELDNLAREEDEPETNEAVQAIYWALHRIHLSRLRAGHASDGEWVFILMLFGVLRPNSEHVVLQLLAATARGTEPSPGQGQHEIPDNVIDPAIERDLLRGDWVKGMSRKIADILSRHRDVSASSERPPIQASQDIEGGRASVEPGRRRAGASGISEDRDGGVLGDPDPMILSLVPGERDWGTRQ